MRRRPPTFAGLLASLLVITATSLHAQTRETILHAETLEKAQPPTRSARTATWPSIGRQISIRLSERQGEWDGMPMSYAEFEGRNLALELRFSDLKN